MAGPCESAIFHPGPMCHYGHLEQTDGTVPAMASAEKLLHEAQFAFQSISFGESLSNTRNALKASSLCKKIIRRYPASMEATEAHAILRRLGEEAYSSKMGVRHRHVPEEVHHRATVQRTRPAPEQQRTFITPDATDALDWAGVVRWLRALPRIVLGAMVVAGFFLFGLFGPILFLPLIALVLFTGPFRQMLGEAQRNNLNMLVQRINAFVADPNK
jgi:hypothetical protein